MNNFSFVYTKCVENWWELIPFDMTTCMCLPASRSIFLLCETYAKSTKFSFNDNNNNNRIILLYPSMTFSSVRQPTFPFLLILFELSTLGRKLYCNLIVYLNVFRDYDTRLTNVYCVNEKLYSVSKEKEKHFSLELAQFRIPMYSILEKFQNIFILNWMIFEKWLITIIKINRACILWTYTL